MKKRRPTARERKRRLDRVYAAAKELASKRHTKDRQEVLERHQSQATEAYRTLRKRGAKTSKSLLWAAAGTLDAIDALVAARNARQTKKQARSKEARLASQRASYDVVRRRIAELESELLGVEAEEEEEEEEESGEESGEGETESESGEDEGPGGGPSGYQGSGGSRRPRGTAVSVAIPVGS